LARNERVKVPLREILTHHWRPLIQGSLSIVVCYALFYISTVFALSYGVSVRHIPRTDFLGMLCVAVLFMALATPLSAALADRFGRRLVLLGASALAALVGFALPGLLSGGTTETLLFLCLALGVMGLTFAPLGALLPELFPTNVAYTGASSAYNLGGILGASLAPYLAQLLLERGGLPWVGYYVSLAAAITFFSLLSMRETGRA
jgi:MFS family permease